MNDTQLIISATRILLTSSLRIAQIAQEAAENGGIISEASRRELEASIDKAELDILNG